MTTGETCHENSAMPHWFGRASLTLRTVLGETDQSTSAKGTSSVAAIETFISRARRRAARLLDPAGPNGSSDSLGADDFYPQESSCQIPGLSHLFELFIGRREDGVFVEIGAYDGKSFSNTWGLANRGWAGLMAEPVPAFAAKARAAHVDHPRVRVVQTAVGAFEGTLEILTSGPLTSANPDLNAEYEEISWAKEIVGDSALTVPMTTLSKLLETELPATDIDVLVVDVEGFESEVFAGYDWSNQPSMMIVELSETHPDIRTTRASDAILMRELVARGYEVAYKDSINTVFVRTDVWESALLSG